MFGTTYQTSSFKYWEEMMQFWRQRVFTFFCSFTALCYLRKIIIIITFNVLLDFGYCNIAKDLSCSGFKSWMTLNWCHFLNSPTCSNICLSHYVYITIILNSYSVDMLWHQQSLRSVHVTVTMRRDECGGAVIQFSSSHKLWPSLNILKLLEDIYKSGDCFYVSAAVQHEEKSLIEIYLCVVCSLK